MSINQNNIRDLNVITESSKLNKITQDSVSMVNSLCMLGILFGLILIIPFADAQVFEKATFQETLSILYDQKVSQSTVISVGFETTDNSEIRISDEVIEKISENEKIRAVVFTNIGECVIGVTEDEQCIMINFDYQQLKGDGGIRMVQDSAREMGDIVIAELDEMLGIESEFHSTFIHTVDDANIILETSGAISGRGAVSATYTVPKQSTDFLFIDIAGKLLPKEVRDAGGFYDIAEKISKRDNSVISLSIIRNSDSNLIMLKISEEIKESSVDISRINALEHFQVDEISRSEIFDNRNVPLNSIIHMIVIPSEESKIDAIATHAITDVTKIENISKKGWFFSSPAGDVLDLKFLFGQDKTVEKNELRVEIGPWDGKTEMSFYSVEEIQKEAEYESMESFMKDGNLDDEDQSQFVVLVVIIVVGIGAAIFYLKGYKPKR